MEELKKIRDEIRKKLKSINEKITDEMLQNATKEELQEYIENIDSIILKLAKIEEILEGNEE